MVVMDVSAAIDAVREGTRSPVYTFLMESGEKTIAPEFFEVEAAQVAWKYVHAGRLKEPIAKTMLRNTIGYVEEFFDNAELAGEALTEAMRLDHSFYDMLYFVLARRTSSSLLTCDHRLAAICEENGIDCIGLADL